MSQEKKQDSPAASKRFAPKAEEQHAESGQNKDGARDARENFCEKSGDSPAGIAGNAQKRDRSQRVRTAEEQGAYADCLVVRLDADLAPG
ncbi:MAG: hypothetical protein U1F20_01110 [Lysobacterales bacterium]